MNQQPKVQFILKRREDYNLDPQTYGSSYQIATGMYNSAKFVSDMLEKNNIQSEVVLVEDNNFISNEVSRFQPTHVFIEGLWVIPSKFDLLRSLHPNVKWIVRIHSELPFLAQEGIATEWIGQYLFNDKVYIAGNSKRVNDSLRCYIKERFGLNYDSNTAKIRIPYLPNYYEVQQKPTKVYSEVNDEYIDVGCFGAVRPLKNHYLQAFAAVDFAKSINKKLRFHMNTTRVEMYGNPVIKNIRKLFESFGSNSHELIEHEWLDRQNFSNLILDMDICMQVSFSETFNIVAAEAVELGLPIVLSKEIYWAYPHTFADPTDTNEIRNKMLEIWSNKNKMIKENRSYLKRFVDKSEKVWLKYLISNQTE